MDWLPSEIITQILSRLPVRSVYVCRSVCKTWLNIIDDRRRFVPLHFSRSLEEKEATTFIFVPSGNRRPIYMVEVKKEQHNYKATQIDFCGPHYNTKYANSCNGLFCFSATPSYSDNDYHTYIHNPATRECVKLPSSFSCLESMDINLPHGDLFVNNLGIGYDFSSNAFKVLQILGVSYGFGHPTSVKAQVYTLGTNSWRQLENFPHVSCFQSIPALINGSLHWPSYENILAFDLASENFGFVEYPQINLVPNAPSVFPEINPRLVVLDGCLSIAVSSSGEDVGLWIMKDYNVKESWIKLVIKRNYLHDRVKFHSVLPITFWKNGELLLLYGSKILVSYDTSGRYTLFEYESFPACKYDFFFKSYSWSEVYPYVGNLMSIDITCRTEAQP
ncbi:F-box protein [Thalictrum thalictroides]|uniref:F-box protein n=1 Tax=Thalictrum thalictroides TaxID=46969 RepID=A0A7J6UYE3_THATH|nr:F-box protein [Thalictrum thalictroides]